MSKLSGALHLDGSISFQEMEITQEKSARAEHFLVLSVLHQALFSGRDKIPFVPGEQVQYKNGWELLQASLLPLPSPVHSSTSQTAGRGSHTGVQTTGTGHRPFTGLWELGSTVLM